MSEMNPEPDLPARDEIIDPDDHVGEEVMPDYEDEEDV